MAGCSVHALHQIAHACFVQCIRAMLSWFLVIRRIWIAISTLIAAGFVRSAHDIISDHLVFVIVDAVYTRHMQTDASEHRLPSCHRMRPDYWMMRFLETMRETSSKYTIQVRRSTLGDQLTNSKSLLSGEPRGDMTSYLPASQADLKTG